MSILCDEFASQWLTGGWEAHEYVPDTSAFSDQRSQGSESLSRYGFDMEISDLVYAGERSPVIEYLAARVWRITAQTLEEVHAANGFEMPDDDMFAAFADALVVSGVLNVETVLAQRVSRTFAAQLQSRR